VYLRGDMAQGLPARVVLLNAAACAGEAHPERSPTCFGPNGVEPLALGLEFIALERGGLPAATLAARTLPGPAYVLSFTQPPDGTIPKRVEARLNGTIVPTDADPSNRLIALSGETSAARGISNGGVVIDATGAVVAVVWSNTEPPGPLLLRDMATGQLETAPPLPPTMDYRLDYVQLIRNLAHFCAEPITLTDAP
jgi:hypothetical protein